MTERIASVLYDSQFLFFPSFFLPLYAGGAHLGQLGSGSL